MEILDSYSREETFEAGKKLGSKAGPGLVIGLIGGLGAGKTVFVKGFAEGLGIKENVSSPTFLVRCDHEGGRLVLHHFDVYRIEDPEEMEEIGYEDCFYGGGVSLVEWADLIEDIMPRDSLYVKIERDLEKGLDYRIIRTGSIDEIIGD